MSGIPSFTLGKTTIRQISRENLKRIQETAIKVWHFERTVRGVIPVAGPFEKGNPLHVKVSDVIKVYP
jgi:hypothetical protein